MPRSLPFHARPVHNEAMIRLILCGVTALLLLAAAPPSASSDAGFRTIFDGRTLDGWQTFDPTYWSVQDGAITATITKEHPLTDNRYLVWKGGDGARPGNWRISS